MSPKPRYQNLVIPQLYRATHNNLRGANLRERIYEIHWKTRHSKVFMRCTAEIAPSVIGRYLSNVSIKKNVAQWCPMQFMLWYCSILMSSRVDDSRQLVHLLELLYTSKIHRRHRQLMGSSLTSESGFNDSISRLSERYKRTVLSRFLLDLEWRGDRNQSWERKFLFSSNIIEPLRFILNWIFFNGPVIIESITPFGQQIFNRWISKIFYFNS